MNLSPRLYAGPQDFKHLDAVLIAGINSGIHTHYVHPGDLRWWLYYTFPDDTPWSRLYLWEDDQRRVAAWTLFSPQEEAVDLFCMPDLQDAPERSHMLAWGVESMTALLRGQGIDELKVYWVREQDVFLRAALEELGFTCGEDSSVHMELPLDSSLPEPALPPGFNLRSSRGLEDLEKRATVQHSAFESDLPMERYLERFRHYMSSLAYVPEQDVVIEAPDGRLAAFARLWPDAATGSGNFEPVGVHQEFHRHGLGRAVMIEGLRRLQQWGMTLAQVGTGSKNLPAIRLYEAVGFSVKWTPLIYEKNISGSGKIA